MKYKCFNFSIESKDRVMFLKKVRDEFGYTLKHKEGPYSLTDSTNYLNGLLSNEYTVVEESEYQFLLNSKYLTFDAKPIGKDHPKYETKSDAEKWFDSLSIEEQEYVKELAFKFTPGPACG